MDKQKSVLILTHKTMTIQDYSNSEVTRCFIVKKESQKCPKSSKHPYMVNEDVAVTMGHG